MLNRFMHLAYFLLLAGIAANASSQDAPPSYQRLKPIESMVGVWESRFDPPGHVPEGDLEIDVQWFGNKSYLQIVVYFKPDGVSREKRLNPEFTVVGFAAKEGLTQAWHFNYTTQGRVEAEIETNRLVIHQQDGEPSDSNYRKQTKTYELEDATTLVITESGDSASAPSSNTRPLRLKKSQ